MDRVKMTGQTQAELDATAAAEEQEVAAAEARAYLQQTDWYITRHAETGVEVPPEILKERQAARERVM